MKTASLHITYPTFSKHFLSFENRDELQQRIALILLDFERREGKPALSYSVVIDDGRAV